MAPAQPAPVAAVLEPPASPVLRRHTSAVHASPSLPGSVSIPAMTPQTRCLTPPRYTLAPKRPFAVAELALQSACINSATPAKLGSASVPGSVTIPANVQEGSGGLTPRFPPRAFHA